MSASLDLVIQSRRVVLGDRVAAAAIGIRGGRIASIGAPGSAAAAAVVDLGNQAILPGLVDTHVHFNEPGRADWEGFSTGTAAALAGGVTTIVDMPLNSSPVTTTVAALHDKASAAAAAAHADYGFWAGLVPGNAARLRSLVDAGALGAKAFLCASGLDEFPPAERADLEAGARVLAEADAPLLVHAEHPEVLRIAAPTLEGGTRSFRRFLASRPDGAELSAIEELVPLARRTGCRVHVVHVASGGCLPLLQASRREGLSISAETCPHYLTLAAEEIDDGATVFKCAPPIRQRANQAALWGGLRSGVLDLVVSDHSPCPTTMRALDSGSFADAWGGIAGVQLGLPLLWSQAAARGVDLPAIARWMSAAPARLAGIADRKGRLAVGHDADLVVFDTEATFEVRGADLLQRHPETPYEGMKLRGRVVSTFLRGRRVYDRGRVTGPPSGRPVREVR